MQKTIIINETTLKKIVEVQLLEESGLNKSLWQRRNFYENEIINN